MAKIKQKTLTFPGSGSPDVVGYKFYYEVSPTAVTYDSANVLLTETMVVLNTITELQNLDAVYNIGISAVDDAGNESDMSLLNDIPLDFAAPEAPGALSLT